VTDHQRRGSVRVPEFIEYIEFVEFIELLSIVNFAMASPRQSGATGMRKSEFKKSVRLL